MDRDGEVAPILRAVRALRHAALSWPYAGLSRRVAADPTSNHERRPNHSHRSVEQSGREVISASAAPCRSIAENLLAGIELLDVVCRHPPSGDCSRYFDSFFSDVGEMLHFEDVVLGCPYALGLIQR